MTEKKSGGSRKIGRWKRKPSNLRYKDSKRSEKNKIRSITKDLYRRVLLVCRKEYANDKSWRDLTNRQMVKADILKEVRAQFTANKHHNHFTNNHISVWARAIISN